MNNNYIEASLIGAFVTLYDDITIWLSDYRHYYIVLMIILIINASLDMRKKFSERKIRKIKENDRGIKRSS